ncbi:MAG: hypothetical protein IPK80_21645 [Nannocystis sp.]|nr:hypothetical protein [Nannocystis sp.]
MSLLRIVAALALGLLLPVHVAAAPPRSSSRQRPSQPERPPESDTELVDAALKAWAAGRWLTVRALLEPLVQAGDLADPLLNETALRYLADATLLDPELDDSIRDQQAASYLRRLFALDPEWRPPPDTHGPKLYDFYNKMREQYERAKLEGCFAERAACDADLEDLKVRHDRLRAEHDALRRAYGQQEVEVREKVARNRAIALLPFGVGHFYNGNKALGATFLATELVAGGIGLSLLVYRDTQCDRTNGFARASLQCVTDDPRALVRRRDAEQALGIAFIGLLVVDVVVSQVIFKPYVTVKTERVRRQDLDAADPDAAPTLPRPGRRQARVRPRDTLLRARPAPTFLPGGGGVGLSLRF